MPLNRRTFLRNSAAALGASLTPRFAATSWANPTGANSDVRVAVIGIHNKGRDHIDSLLKIPGVRVVGVCDVDPQNVAKVVDELKTRNVTVYSTTDMRDILARSDVDAVTIATSNHWHALATIWACQAGKDVYVEKPISHMPWEGRKMIEAANRYNRIVQAGTQFRSDTGLPEAISHIRSGALGRIKFIHALWYKLRTSIGRKLPWYPDWLDYDMFCGPTPVMPLERDQLHYDWHWMWRTGNGDLANLGVHTLDISRRFAAHETLPRRTVSIGGRFATDDAGETPNTQITLFDYPEIPVYFESRGLPAKPGVRYMDQLRGIRTGVIVQCEGGYYAGYLGGAIYDNSGKQIRNFPGDGGASHMSNFIDAVRSRRKADLNGPIEVGHASTLLCHFGNISYRCGREAPLSEAKSTLESVPAAQETLESIRDHLGIHGIDLDRRQLSVGRWVDIDSGNETVAAVDGADERTLDFARYLVHETQRAPYAVPEKV